MGGRLSSSAFGSPPQHRVEDTMTYPSSYHVNQSAIPGRAPGTKPILISGIAVAVLAALGIVLVLMYGFGPSVSPTEVTEKYMTAIVDADLIAAVELKCDEDVQRKHEEWGGTTPSDEAVAAAVVNAEDLAFAIIEGSEVVSGDTATVNADVTTLDGTSMVTARLVLEGGEWRICGEF